MELLLKSDTDAAFDSLKDMDCLDSNVYEKLNSCFGKTPANDKRVLFFPCL